MTEKETDEATKKLIAAVDADARLLMPCVLCGKITHRRGFTWRVYLDQKLNAPKLVSNIFALCDRHNLENKTTRARIRRGLNIDRHDTYMAARGSDAAPGST